MPKKYQSLVKNTALYLVASICNRLGAFLLLPIYTYYLSLADYGSLELVYSFNSMLAVILGAGLSHATTRFYFEKQSNSYRHSVITTNFTMATAIALVSLLFINSFSPQIGPWIFASDQAITLFYLVLCIIFFELANEILFAYLRILEKAKLFLLLACFRLFFQISISISLLKFYDLGLYGVLSANLCSVVVLNIFLLGFTIKQCSWKIDTSLCLPILRYSMPLAMSGIVATAVANVDKFLVKQFIGLEALAVYGLAMKFALLMSFLLIEPFSRSYGPYRFSIFKETHAIQTNANIGFYVLVCASIMALAISLSMPAILILATNINYMPAAELTPILLLGFVALSLNYCFETGILIYKKTTMIVKITLLYSLFAIALYALLLPKYGLLGAALGFTLANIFRAFFTWRYSNTVYPVPYPLRSMLLVILASIMTYGFVSQFQFSIWWVQLLWAVLWVFVFILSLCILIKRVRQPLLIILQKHVFSRNWINHHG